METVDVPIKIRSLTVRKRYAEEKEEIVKKKKRGFEDTNLRICEFNFRPNFLLEWNYESEEKVELIKEGTVYFENFQV